MAGRAHRRRGPSKVVRSHAFFWHLRGEYVMRYVWDRSASAIMYTVSLGTPHTDDRCETREPARRRLPPGTVFGRGLEALVAGCGWGNQHGAAEGILGVADEKRRVGARGMGMATGA